MPKMLTLVQKISHDMGNDKCAAIRHGIEKSMAVESHRNRVNLANSNRLHLIVRQVYNDTITPEKTDMGSKVPRATPIISILNAFTNKILRKRFIIPSKIDTAAKNLTLPIPIKTT